MKCEHMLPNESYINISFKDFNTDNVTFLLEIQQMYISNKYK